MIFKVHVYIHNYSYPEVVPLVGCPRCSVAKESLASAGDAGDVGSIPGVGRSSGEGKTNLRQYSCLGDPMDRGAWQTTVLGIAKSWT